MTRPRSKVALAELDSLQKPDIGNAVISFAELASIRTTAWAVEKFGGQVLVERVKQAYHQNPQLNAQGRTIYIDDLSGHAGTKLRYEQEEAEDTAIDIAQDLNGAMKRLHRGYGLETATIRGVDDTVAVLGSLEKAVEINPDNLDTGEQHFQAAAAYMLEHMVTQQDGTSREYLL